MLVYDGNSDATLANKAIFLDLDRVVSRPAPDQWWVGTDGLLPDQHDNLYIAEYGAGRIIIVNREGQLQEVLRFPERFVTAARFGPTEEALFVTAPSNNTVPPFVGRVYVVRNPMFRRAKD